MRYLKHFYKKGIGLIKSVTCRHNKTRESACPYTGITYTICTECSKLISGRNTEN